MSDAVDCQLCRGACCETLRIPIPTDKESLEFMAARGTLQANTTYTVNRRTKVMTPRRIIAAVLETRCPKLTEDGMCSIHETSLPTICRLYKVGGTNCLQAIKERRPELARHWGLEDADQAASAIPFKSEGITTGDDS